MSFSAEVDAVRQTRASEAAQRRELEEPARVRFENEVRDLWLAAEEYRRGHAEIVDLGVENWAVTGHMVGKFGDNMGAKPYPLRRVFKPQRSRTDFTRTRAEWKNRTPVPRESVEGISIDNWFALCKPGQIRELAVSDQRGYLQVPWAGVRDTVNGGDDSTFGMVFVGSKREPVIVLRCAAEGPIEVHAGSGDVWERQGTLREVVVSAVSYLPVRVAPEPDESDRMV